MDRCPREDMPILFAVRPTLQTEGEMLTPTPPPPGQGRFAVEIPKTIASADAAPLMCAGVTTFW